MSFVHRGEIVRLYHEEYCYDEGEVLSVIDGIVTVDFYDWIERWPESALNIRELFHEGKEVLVPTRRGEIVLDFREQPEGDS